MTQEDKELLLKDLCARLPYGVKVLDDIGRTYTLNVGNAYFIDLLYSNGNYVEPPFKPYLRPMSSMTEEERVEYFSNRMTPWAQNEFGESYTEAVMQYRIDFLLEHHFDYRGLIDKGLAIEVTKENNPYKD